MGRYNFNTRECIHALTKLGFVLSKKRRGNHDKYLFPERFEISVNQRPFIMIPRHNELRLQDKIIKQLEIIGGQSLVDQFLQLL